VKLSNIKVSEWDGQFEEPITLTPNKTQDLARLKNADRVSGNVKSIAEGKLAIEATNTSLDIPISRVKQIELSSPAAKRDEVTPKTVRAYFAGGLGTLTFNLEKWTPDELVASSPSFGSAKFKPNAFSKILFDLESAPPPANGAP
jgi:hypothetical protein